MRNLLALFSPNRAVDKNTAKLLIGCQFAALLIVWILARTVFLPKPSEILAAFSFLWKEEGLGGELITSFFLNVEALVFATLISLLLAYATVMPFFRPVVAVLSKLRFLSLAGLSFFFTLLATNGHQLKLSLLVFSVSVFFVTGMADVIEAAPRESFDLARTLGMNEWRTVYEVIILGQADKAFTVLRQNAAIGWMMLSMVEGISREGGGIGTLLLNQNKHFHLDAVFAIQLTILILGLGQDYAIGAFRRMICPYADLALERK